MYKLPGKEKEYGCHDLTASHICISYFGIDLFFGIDIPNHFTDTACTIYIDEYLIAIVVVVVVVVVVVFYERALN